MKTTLWRGLSTGALGCLAATQASAVGNAAEVRLITLDPGHFHAALFQKEMIPGQGGKEREADKGENMLTEIKNLVDAIKTTVAKIEPKLPTHALGV